MLRNKNSRFIWLEPQVTPENSFPLNPTSFDFHCGAALMENEHRKSETSNYDRLFLQTLNAAERRRSRRVRVILYTDDVLCQSQN